MRWTPSTSASGPDAERLTRQWTDPASPPRMVLLGDPGSGKSFLVSAVLRQLRETTPSGAVLIPFSSWNPAVTNLRSWLAEWSPSASETLILDGLDEIAPEHARKALESLDERGGRILLTSRTAEYRALGVELPRAQVVVLDAHDPAEAVRYLRSRSGDPTRWDAVEPHPALTTPLLVTLADAVYNGPDAPDPRTLRTFGDADALAGHLLGHLVPARYPGSGDAGRWLGYLARTPDIRWWSLPVRRAGPPHVATVLGATAWTAVSAGLLNGWVFASMGVALTDAVRISVAVLLCYFALWHLTGTYRAALVAAVGAYVTGTLSGSFDLAIAAGLVAGFAWRPLRPRRVRRRDAMLVGGVIAGAFAAIRGLGEVLGFRPELTRGFAAGVVDGFTLRWDEDVNGVIAVGLVATALVWALLRPAGGRPVVLGAAVGLAVAAVNSWADGANPHVGSAWLIAPADGLAAGLAVWWATRGAPALVAAGDRAAPQGRRAVARRLPAAGIGVAAAGLNAIGYATRADVHAGWARALAEGIAVAAVIGLGRAEARTPVIWGRAVVIGVLVGVLHGLSAGVAAGIAAGAGLGLAVASLARDRPDPIRIGTFALVFTGLFAGFSYGLLYGVVAGLAWRLAGSIARRRQPSLVPSLSLRDAAGGALLGALTVLAAAFNHLAAPWLVLIGATSGLAGAFAFGLAAADQPAGTLTASPRGLYVRDRATFVLVTTIVATALALAVGARTLAGGPPGWVGAVAALSTFATYGVTAGLVTAAAVTRFGAFTATRAWLAAHDDAPWPLMTFLHDAHVRRQILRGSGAVYQFRYAHLAAAIRRNERTSG